MIGKILECLDPGDCGIVRLESGDLFWDVQILQGPYLPTARSVVSDGYAISLSLLNSFADASNYWPQSSARIQVFGPRMAVATAVAEWAVSRIRQCDSGCDLTSYNMTSTSYRLENNAPLTPVIVLDLSFFSDPSDLVLSLATA